MREKIKQTARLQRLISCQFLRNLERKVMDTGVYRSQHQMLMCLGDNSGCSQRVLAEKMNISTAAVTTTLKKLEKGGYIIREVSNDDNRTNQLQVTEKGKKIIEQSKQLFDELECDMYAGFSEDELNQLFEYYEKILGNLKKQSEKEA